MRTAAVLIAVPFKRGIQIACVCGPLRLIRFRPEVEADAADGE